MAIAALGQIEEEARQLDKQWALRRERACYEAERARRQYDAVEPENRLVARSLERTWEERLRAAEAIEQEYARWRRDEPLVLSQADHAALQVLGEDLPRSGTPQRPPRRSASVSCALSCTRSFSTSDHRDAGSYCPGQNLMSTRCADQGAELSRQRGRGRQSVVLLTT